MTSSARWAAIKSDPVKLAAWNAAQKKRRDARGEADRSKEREKMRRLRAESVDHYREKVRKSQAKTKAERPWLVLWRAAKRRATEAGLEFDLLPEDLMIPDFCPVLGIPLAAGVRHHVPGSPSVDRVDNAKGYVRGNVMVISRRANVLKGNATLAEAKMVADYMATHFAKLVTVPA